MAVENNQFSTLQQIFFKNHFEGKYYFEYINSFITYLSTKLGVLQSLVCTYNFILCKAKNMTPNLGDSAAPTQSTTSNSQVPMMRRHANSAPPSPKKSNVPITSKSKAPAAPKMNAKKGAKPTLKKTVTIDNNDDISGNDDVDGSDEDGEGEGFDQGSEPKDALAKYEKMRDKIQHEHVVCAHLFLFQPILTLNDSPQGNIVIKAKIHACRTCALCLRLGKSLIRGRRK